MPAILIADDNDLSLHFLAEAARICGWTPTLAADGAETLRLATTHRYDLILLDLRMPDLDGAAVLERLRASKPWRSYRVPVIATSADASAGIDQACRRAGFAEFIEKPLTLSILSAALARHWPRTTRPGEVKAHHIVHDRRLPLLDDDTAVNAIGHLAIVNSLRVLFAKELDALIDAFDQYVADGDEAVRERLHRLRASCGFCGALALGAVCREWSEAQTSDERAAKLREVRRLIDATRSALVDGA